MEEGKLSDEGYVIESLFRIADKEGNDVDFELNSAQRAIDTTLGRRNIIPKARQEGVSSYFLARSAVRCMMKRNTRAVVISHDQESTQRLLAKVHYYIREIKGPGPEIKNMSANEITFPKMNSMFYIGTAGSRKFGRGDTITDLHCSEYAFWPNPKGLMAGLLQAVPKSGFVSIESTGNGLNDYYHRCMRAAKGADLGSFRYKLHFLPWHTFEEYTEELTAEEEANFMASLDEALEEPQLAEMLTPGQLAWRRGKIEELDYDVRLFKQEYPMTLDECFQMTGESVFHKVNYVKSSKWQKEAPSFHALKGHPKFGYHYVVGGDVSAGVGQDSSVLEVLCLETNEQVGEWSHNRTDPEQFAEKAAECGKRYYNAYIVIENNNHGILTLAALKKIYPPGLIHSSGGSASQLSGVEKNLSKLGYRTAYHIQLPPHDRAYYLHRA
jgi:hypothetical protein